MTDPALLWLAAVLAVSAWLALGVSIVCERLK